jgi:hypothetical protein
MRQRCTAHETSTNMAALLFTRINRIWTGNACVRAQLFTRGINLSSRPTHTFFTPNIQPSLRRSAKQFPLVQARSFSQSSLLQFARARILNARQTWYPPPPRRGSGWSNSGFLNGLRRRVDRINPDTVFYGIIGINAAVFAGW